MQVVDGVACPILRANSTTIECTVGDGTAKTGCVEFTLWVGASGGATSVEVDAQRDLLASRQTACGRRWWRPGEDGRTSTDPFRG